MSEINPMTDKPVQRYDVGYGLDIGSFVEETDTGDWCRSSDVSALEAENARLREALTYIARNSCKVNPRCSSRIDYACDSCTARDALEEKPQTTTQKTEAKSHPVEETCHFCGNLVEVTTLGTLRYHRAISAGGRCDGSGSEVRLARTEVQHKATSNICHRCGNQVQSNDHACPHCHCIVNGGV